MTNKHIKKIILLLTVFNLALYNSPLIAYSEGEDNPPEVVETMGSVNDGELLQNDEEPNSEVVEENGEKEKTEEKEETKDTEGTEDTEGTGEAEENGEPEEPEEIEDTIEEDGVEYDGLIVSDASKVSYDESTGILTVIGDVEISGTKNSSGGIVIAQDAKVTLVGVKISNNNGPGLKINADVKAVLVLNDGSENEFNGSSDYAGIEVAWESSNLFADLTIEGNGSLKAQGGSKGAGIGGSKAATGIYGNITINGGNITSIGGSGAAGIGSGTNPADGTSHGSNNPNYNESWGKITICGGNIDAIGGSSGAGIGGGSHTSSGEIIINGGTVKASGDSGIGSGLGSSKGDDKGPGYYYANVTINGGDITAYATNNMGAGISGGMYGDAYVTITGGKINASVNTSGKAYQGGAGIGGGYQGTAVINIYGGEIKATGGNGSPGIGNGALGASTTTSDYSDGQWTGTKSVRTPGATIKENESVVNIYGGTVKAYGGVYGSGIGSGNAGEWCNVNISGGDIYAMGGMSTEEEMAGGAGIGSGVKYAPSKIAYSKETDVNITITGGNVKAIGGWGAAAIGSGAGNKTAETITIDANNAEIEAYADGTKFAIDTRKVNEDGTTTSITQGREIYGNIFQGVFVHKGVIGDYQQNPEGLDPIILTNDKTNQTKTLTGIPEGYRSFATSVSEAGTYTIYSDDSHIGKGQGRYFAKTAKDFYDEDEILEEGVKYSVSAGKISDNFYLYPVKSVVIEKKIVTTGSLEKEMINQTVNFALWDDQAKDYIRNKNGDIWIESIEIVGGEAQGRAYFTNIEDKTYGIWEVNEDGSNPKGTKYKEYQLTDITTSHGDGEDNDAQINDEIWTDKVIVNNTYSPLEETKPDTNPQSGSNPTPQPSPNPTPQPSSDSVPQPGTAPVPQATLVVPTPRLNPTPVVDDEPTPVEEIDEPEVPLVDLEVIENQPTPLSEGADEHTCCILHFILMALTLLVICIYTKRRKDVQKDIDEKQDELLNLCKDLGILKKLIEIYPELTVEDFIKEVMEND